MDGERHDPAAENAAVENPAVEDPAHVEDPPPHQDPLPRHEHVDNANERPLPENLRQGDSASVVAELVAKMTEVLQRPAVNVNVHLQNHRIGTFTGLKPVGGHEVSFPVWKDQVALYLSETTDDDTIKCRKVFGALKGVSKEQAKRCLTAEDIVEKLTSLYAVSKCAEDVYIDFLQLKLQKGEAPADFLL